MKDYKLRDNKNNLCRISRSMRLQYLRPNSQPMESMKTKTVSQRVEDDITPRSLVGLISFRISPDVTPGGDCVDGLCHTPLPKIRWSRDAMRVSDAYTQEKYPSIRANP